MSATSEMLAELAPKLAPTVEHVDDDQLVGMWAYRDEGIERLMWRGGNNDCEQLESAVETSLWLFEDRRSQGDTATIEVADGTVVIEHGTRGVIAAWYADDTRASRETDLVASRSRSADHGAAEGKGAEQGAAGTGSLTIDTQPDPTLPSDGSATGTSTPPESGLGAPKTDDTRVTSQVSAPGADRTVPAPDDIVERPGDDPPVQEGSQTSRGRSEPTGDATDSPPATGRTRQGGASDASPREARSPSGGQSGRSRQSGRNQRQTRDKQSDGQPASRADSQPLNFEIAFVDQNDSGSGSGMASSRTGPVCDWADVIDHLEALTEMVNDHLGDTVTMNYWREALENHDSLEEAIDVELYGGMEARDRSAQLDRDQAAELHEARSEWVRRCRRTISSTASGLHEAPEPPWSELLDAP